MSLMQLKNLPSSEKEANLPANTRGWLLAHFGLYAIGLAKLAQVLGARLARAWPAPPTPFFDWAMALNYAGKREELLFFLLILSVFGLYFLALQLLTIPSKGLVHAIQFRLLKNNRWSLFATGLAINFTVCLVGDIGRLDQLSVLHFGLRGLTWVAGFISPLYFAKDYVLNWISRLERSAEDLFGARSPAWKVLLILAALQFAFMLIPFLSGRIRLMNEFADLPETTLLGDKWVDNASFINEHGILGLTKRSLATATIPYDSPFLYANLQPNPEIAEFIADHRYNFSYDSRTSRLRTYGPMSRIERDELIKAADQDEKAEINRLFAESHLKAKTDYSPEEVEFLSLNQKELASQFLNRWVLHHHNFVLGAINQLALGRPSSEVIAQYGILSAAATRQLLQWTGGVNLENYFRVWYSFWAIYFAALLCLLFWLFDDIRYVALAFATSVSFVARLGFEVLFLGPGLNPIRHFFDLPIAFLLAFYFRHHKRSALWAAVPLCVLSILNNNQSGLALLFAAVAALFLSSWFETGKFPFGGALAATACLGAGMFIGRIGTSAANPLVPYYLSGQIGFATDPKFFPLLIAGLAAGYLLLSRFSSSQHPMKYLALFLFIYSQGILLYYAWGATAPHFLNFSAIFVLTAFVFMKFVADEIPARRFENLLLAGLGAVLLAVFIAPPAYTYFSQERAYNNYFRGHRTYEWSFDSAHVQSTIDPKPFEDSIELIQRYSQGRGIHLISKYDSVLPFLAHRYSEMPFFDLSWYLMTPREVERTVQTIQSARPPYLFVDSDIDLPLQGDIIRSDAPGMREIEDTESLMPVPNFGAWSHPRSIYDPYLSQLRSVRGDYVISIGQESAMRVDRLSKLKEVFDRVKADYTPIASCPLLTVYERKARP